MQYQSIIRLFNHLGIAYNVSSDLFVSRIKKQINAEFAIEANGIIIIDGISYTKNDVLNAIDSSNWSDIIQFHKEIWEHKGLLQLLESDKLDLDKAHEWYSLSKNEAFVALLSPYFAPRFNSVMKTILQTNNLVAAAEWLSFSVFVLPQDDEVAYKSLRFYLDDALRLFKNINEVSYKQREAEFDIWASQEWSSFINKLPESLLHYTDELASEVINFTVRIQKEDRQLCYIISSQLVRLKQVNYSLKQLIIENHEIYAENRNGSIKRKRGMPPAYVWVLGIIALLRFLTSDFSCKNSSDNITVVRTVIDDSNGNKFVRIMYQQAYANNDTGNLSNAELAKVSFSFDPIYVLYQTEENKLDLSYPIILKNRTRYQIKLDMLSTRNLYNMVSDSTTDLMFMPSNVHNFDFVMSIDNTNSSGVKSGFTFDKMQLLHFSNGKVPPHKKIEFANEETVPIRMLLRSDVESSIPNNTLLVEEKMGN